MNENKLREQRGRLRSEKIYHSRRLSDVFPDVERVEVRASILFEPGAADVVEKEYCIVLVANDKLYVYVPCPNKDCTGFGFELTDVIRESIRKRENSFGEVTCDEKEDWKYFNSSGHTCQSTLSYAVFLQYLSEGDSDLICSQ